MEVGTYKEERLGWRRNLVVKMDWIYLKSANLNSMYKILLHHFIYFNTKRSYKVLILKVGTRKRVR